MCPQRQRSGQYSMTSSTAHAGNNGRPLTFVTGLGALFATRWILATLRRAGRRIGARGNRRVARAAVQPTLKLGDPLILAHDPRGQRLDLSIHPQQHLDNCLTTSVIDRFRLNPLHTKTFDTTPLQPPNQLNAYQNQPLCRDFLIGETGFEPATARPPAGCATRLRHSPWCLSILRRKRARDLAAGRPLDSPAQTPTGGRARTTGRTAPAKPRSKASTKVI
jgi:hypothetical protein